MGAPRGSEAGPALVPDRTRRGRQAAAVLDFAVARILRDDTALGALPAVLERLVAAFGLRAALAFQPSAGQPATVLAAHPPGRRRSRAAGQDRRAVPGPARDPVTPPRPSS